MDLACPFCASNAHDFVAALDLPPEGFSDEVQLQVLLCRQCRSRYGARYEESRAGRLDSESWHHFVVAKDGDEVRALEQLIAACPTPHEPRCPCESHRSLAEPGGLSRLLARHLPPPARASVRSMLLRAGGLALLWLGLWWNVEEATRYRWFFWLVVPPLTSFGVWLLATPAFRPGTLPRPPRWWSIGGYLALLAGLGCGVDLALRF
jgi:hypothetical protein